MRNPKTTVAGYLTLGASVLYMLAQLFTTGLDASSINGVLAAMAGVGLISANDGGH